MWQIYVKLCIKLYKYVVYLDIYIYMYIRIYIYIFPQSPKPKKNLYVYGYNTSSFSRTQRHRWRAFAAPWPNTNVRPQPLKNQKVPWEWNHGGVTEQWKQGNHHLAFTIREGAPTGAANRVPTSPVLQVSCRLCDPCGIHGWWRLSTWTFLLAWSHPSCGRCRCQVHVTTSSWQHIVWSMLWIWMTGVDRMPLHQIALLVRDIDHIVFGNPIT